MGRSTAMLFDSEADKRDFFDTYIAVNYGYARREAENILKNTEDAADAVQEAMLAAWEKLGQLRSPECVESWFRRILRNKAMSIYRDAAREEPVAEFDERMWATCDPGPETVLLRNEEMRMLGEAFTKLCPTYRRHIYYRALLQLSTAEINALMHISEKARCNAYNRARAALKRFYYGRRGSTSDR